MSNPRIISGVSAQVTAGPDLVARAHAPGSSVTPPATGHALSTQGAPRPSYTANTSRQRTSAPATPLRGTTQPIPANTATIHRMTLVNSALDRLQGAIQGDRLDASNWSADLQSIENLVPADQLGEVLRPINDMMDDRRAAVDGALSRLTDRHEGSGADIHARARAALLRSPLRDRNPLPSLPGSKTDDKPDLGLD